MANLDFNQTNEDDEEKQAYNRLLWSASYVLSLGIISKFTAGYRRQREELSKEVDARLGKRDLDKLLHQIQQKFDAIENMADTPQKYRDVYCETFLLILRKQVSDALHELHQQLLDYEVDTIIDIIPLLDQLRSFWQPNPKETFNPSQAELEHYRILLIRLRQNLQQEALI